MFFGLGPSNSSSVFGPSPCSSPCFEFLFYGRGLKYWVILVRLGVCLIWYVGVISMSGGDSKKKTADVEGRDKMSGTKRSLESSVSSEPLLLL